VEVLDKDALEDAISAARQLLNASAMPGRSGLTF